VLKWLFNNLKEAYAEFAPHPPTINPTPKLRLKCDYPISEAFKSINYAKMAKNSTKPCRKQPKIAGVS
jgi:hypothetical protein